MNFLKWRIAIFLIAVILYATGIFFSYPEHFGFCSHSAKVTEICTTDSFLNRGETFMNAGIIFFVIASLLLFANEKSLSKWLRFSYWFIPIAALILIFLTPVAVPLGEIDTATITKWLGVLYIFITFCIVSITRLRTSK